MRNGLVFQNLNIASGIARLIKGDAFVSSAVQALLYVSEHGTKTRQVLDEAECDAQKISRVNVGLVLEKMKHRILWSATKGKFTSEDLNAFCLAVANGLTADEKIYEKGNLADPSTFDYRLSVQFNKTHRMFISRNAQQVDNVTDPETGLVTQRNPFGWMITFVPNEYSTGYLAEGAVMKTYDLVLG